MKTKFFFFLAMLLMSSVGAFAQSESKTPLKGDVNEDGIVDAADVVEVVNIIMKKGVDSNKYYWYIGTENPASISNIQTDNTVGGWHEIGSSLSGFVLDTNDNPVHISETRVPYYIVIPNELDIYDSLGDKMYYVFDAVTCNISGYKAYKWNAEKDGSGAPGVKNVTGVIIKSNDNIDPNKYYWYIGTENPASISNIQSDNTVGGWHEVGSSLSGFVLDTNDNPVHISETRVPYYIVIPNELDIYDSLGDKMDYAFDAVTCNISGYKAYKWSKEKFGSKYDGVINVGGVIIKSDNIDSNKYYWYIGVDNPSSISNIQTDNTVPGWHEIGSSLSGFVLDTDTNPVVISTTRVPYYVIIPNGLHIYDGLNTNIEELTFDPATCNISGYKSFKWSAEKDGGGFDGVREVVGVHLKQ